MAFELIEADEPLPPKNLVIVLFGEWGVGKTSLGFTAEDPLLLDYDKGLERAVGRKTSVKLKTWEDSQEFMESGTLIIKKIKTLIVDTAGALLNDYLTHYLIKIDAKNGNGSDGLGLRGYGAMKNSADRFITKIQQLEIDSIFICHTSEDGDSDNKRLKPRVTGGSYEILMAKADLVGYLEMKSGKITLDFNPTDRHAGKNCAQFPVLNIPSFDTPEYQGYMAKIISQTKAHMQKASAAQVAAVKMVEEFKEKIEASKNIEELEDINQSIQKLSTLYKVQVNQVYERKYLEFWKPIYMNKENLKEGSDFDILASLISDLPKTMQLELRNEFSALLKEAGLIYQKNLKDPKLSGTYIKPTQAPATPTPVNTPAATASKENKAAEPAKTEQPKNETPPPAKIVHEEEWFVERIGKNVNGRSLKFNGPILIENAAKAGHMCHISQTSGGYEFSDIVEEQKVTIEPVMP